jgi:dienelactone hydrolase
MTFKNSFMTILLMVSFHSFAQMLTVNYKDEDKALTGFGYKPKEVTKDNSGVLILPAWMGIDEHSKESASELAKLGYYTFVADIYGVDNRPKNTAEAGKNAGFYKKNYTDYQKRIQLALDQLVKLGANPDKIVVMGYCFGGTGALEAARGNLKVQGAVSFHGGLGKDSSRPIGKIAPKILVLHGADDPFVPKEEVDNFQNEMKASGADWQMVFYANAVHAFTHKDAGSDNSRGAAYNELADKRSWIALKDFLKEVL